MYLELTTFALENRSYMVRNDYYNLRPADVRMVIGLCEKDGVASIAIEGYEWLMHEGLLGEKGYLRLMGLYKRHGDHAAASRVMERYNKIYA